MKKLILTAITLAVIILGCQEETGILSPTNTSVETSRDLSKANWLGLPKYKDLSTETVFTTSKLIDGNIGGSLYLNQQYNSVDGYVVVFAEMQFEPGSFEGERLISLTLDDESGDIECSPAGEFLKPALYNFTIEGMSLDGVEADNVEFVYMNAHGNLELITYKSIRVQDVKGKIRLSNAEIPHFSRFGFVK